VVYGEHDNKDSSGDNHLKAGLVGTIATQSSSTHPNPIRSDDPDAGEGPVGRLGECGSRQSLSYPTSVNCLSEYTIPLLFPTYFIADRHLAVI
jgi:hypothetical protein